MVPGPLAQRPGPPGTRFGGAGFVGRTVSSVMQRRSLALTQSPNVEGDAGREFLHEQRAQGPQALGAGD